MTLSWAVSKIAMGNMLHTNIVHRVDTDESSLQALEYQRTLARDLSLPVTTLFSYNALFNDQIVQRVLTLDLGALEEFGLHFWSYQGERFQARYQTREPALWLLPRSLRTAFLAE